MKVIIEQALGFYGNDDYKQVISEFSEIVQGLSRCANKNEVIKLMAQSDALKRVTHFAFGYGSNHLWLKQLDNFGTKASDRILFVMFDEEKDV